MTPKTLPPFTISEQALHTLKQMREQKQVPESFYVRVGVKTGAGCQGIHFLLGFDQVLPTDTVYEQDGIRLVVDKSHVMHVVGMKIDYTETGNSKGFVFDPKDS